MGYFAETGFLEQESQDYHPFFRVGVYPIPNPAAIMFFFGDAVV